MKEEIFRNIFDKNYQGLLRFAQAYVKDIQIAENLVQDAFILLWENRSEFEDNANFQAFLVRTVKLKAWNYLEKQRRRLAIETDIHDDMVRELDLNLYTLDSLHTTSIYLEEIETVIRKTLDNLSEQTRTIFNLSRYEYLTNNEIAEKMNLSVKSVEFHISKTLKLLRLALADYIKILLIITGGF